MTAFDAGQWPGLLFAPSPPLAEDTSHDSCLQAASFHPNNTKQPEQFKMIGQAAVDVLGGTLQVSLKAVTTHDQRC